MQEAVERIRDVQNVQIFQNELLLLKEYMKNIGMEKEDLLKLERTAYYIKNEYSDKDTKENMYRMLHNTGMTYLKGLGVKDSTLWDLSGGDRSDESNSNG